jgi:hypothetical protein
VMWVIVALSVPMLALARTLPVTLAERRAQGVAGAAAGRPRVLSGEAQPGQ